MPDNSIDDELEERIEDLLTFCEFSSTSTGMIHRGASARAYEWMTTAANLVAIATGRRGIHWDQAEKILNEATTPPIYMQSVEAMNGILRATKEDRKRGLLKQLEYAIYAETFDDFLDHAADLHKRGQVEGSAVLVSAALEDTMKKIPRRNGLEAAATLDPAIDDLVKEGCSRGRSRSA